MLPALLHAPMTLSHCYTYVHMQSLLSALIGRTDRSPTTVDGSNGACGFRKHVCVTNSLVMQAYMA